MTTSKHLTAAQLRALRKVGDVVVPGDHEFPAFSRSGAIDHVDRMFDYMHEADRDGVKALLLVLRFLPRPAIRQLLRLSEQDARVPNALGAVFRMVNIGLKGVIMTLYYSDLGDGVSIHRLIGYDAKVAEREESEDRVVAEAV